MKRLLYIVFAFCIIIPMQGKPSRKGSAEINVGTFNGWGNRQRSSMVYKYKKDFYALDFELRTKKTDETADISMRYVCSESFGLVADSMEDFKRKSRKRR